MMSLSLSSSAYNQIQSLSFDTISCRCLLYISANKQLLMYGWIRNKNDKWHTFPIVIINLSLIYKDYFSVFPTIVNKILSINIDVKSNINTILSHTRKILTARNFIDVEIFDEISNIILFYSFIFLYFYPCTCYIYLYR